LRGKLAHTEENLDIRKVERQAIELTELKCTAN
jgi:hypothetical protein